MCRLLGVVAEESAPLADLLTGVLHPFLRLAGEHKDGWGIAYRAEGGRIEIVKGRHRADRSARLFRQVQEIRTDAAFLHLRMASQNFAINVANTHPFGDAHTAFAHNGDFAPVAILDEVIGPDLLATARGTTDSERFHLAVRRRMTDGLETGEAIARTARDVRTTANRLVSLNCLLLTSDALFAYAEHASESDVIQRRGEDFFDLRYARDRERRRIVVASEGWPRPDADWQLLPARLPMKLQVAKPG
ncbi:class II glutamine amidotransferase [Streptomyces sp. NPDC005529]|uniref:class II glutamine amidotransferase n=1 Tax=unclassified Streptomyces TaxID=2593676 RepID=UPI0033ABC906